MAGVNTNLSGLGKHIQAVFFDLDGTLIDTDDQFVASLARYLAPLMWFLPLAPSVLARRLAMWAETPGNTLMTMFDVVGLDDNVFAIGDTLRQWRGLHRRQDLPLIPGAAMTLHTLSPHYQLAIVTTRGRRDAKAFLTQHKLAPLFDLVVTRESTRRLKPHPEPIRFAAKMLGIPPQRCVMVGDTAVDVRSARSAGAWAVATLSGFGTREELERAGAHLVLESVGQMVDMPLDNLP